VTSDLLVKRLMMQASVSVLAGLLMSSAVMAEDMSRPVGGPDISIEVDAPDTSIDLLAMESEGPDVSIDPVEISVEAPEISIDPIEMWGMPEETPEASMTAVTARGEAAAPHGQAASQQATSRGEGASNGSGYIWTRTESLR